MSFSEDDGDSFVDADAKQLADERLPNSVAHENLFLLAARETVDVNPHNLQKVVQDGVAGGLSGRRRHGDDDSCGFTPG